VLPSAPDNLTMGYELDPDLAAITADAPPRAWAARDDWQTLREYVEAGLALLDSMLPEHAEVTRTAATITSYDGAEIAARWYDPAPDRARGAAVLYLHGGGMIMGSVAGYDRLVAAYVADAGVPFLSVEYRAAPEHPHPTPVEDCFAALQWLVQHSDELGFDPARVAVMGDSGGGGLAAGVALLARDRGVALARQVLVYPMLDDRTTVPEPDLVPFAAWSYDDNYTGWHALLGDAIGGADVPATAAPARATDVSGLPPTYIDVGNLDIFCDEDIEYARRIAAAGTTVELHVHPGCPHGFDRIPGLPVGQRAYVDRLRVLRAL
jgi:acetyl esterase/lipase